MSRGDLSTLKEGSHYVAAEKTSGAMSRLGYVGLKVKYAAWVAQHGPSCWRTDKVAQAQIPKKPDGTPYHRKSFPRARRELVRDGVLTSERIHAHRIPPRAELPTPHGTTSKSVVWSRIGLRGLPMTRGERRLLRTKVLAADRRAEHAAAIVRRTSSSSTPPPGAPRQAMLGALVDPQFAAMVAGIGSPAERTRTRVTSQRPIDREHSSEEEMRAKASDARQRLAEWERRNERGPP